MLPTVSTHHTQTIHNAHVTTPKSHSYPHVQIGAYHVMRVGPGLGNHHRTEPRLTQGFNDTCGVSTPCLVLWPAHNRRAQRGRMPLDDLFCTPWAAAQAVDGYPAIINCRQRAYLCSAALARSEQRRRLAVWGAYVAPVLLRQQAARLACPPVKPHACLRGINPRVYLIRYTL